MFPRSEICTVLVEKQARWMGRSESLNLKVSPGLSSWGCELALLPPLRVLGDEARRHSGQHGLVDPVARTVTFAWKDYAQGAKRKTMRLDLREFLRRFCLHLLPERFVKIRPGGA